MASGLLSQAGRRWRAALDRYRSRIGRFDPPGGKTVLVCRGDALSPEALGFVQQVEAAFPREHVLYLRHGAPAGPVTHGGLLPYPFPLWGCDRYLRRLRATLILVDRGARPPARFLRRALQRRIGLVFVERQAPVALASLAGPGQLLVDAHSDGFRASLTLLAATMGAEQETPESLKKRLKTLYWRHISVRWFGGGLRRLRDLNALAEQLGHPRHILCLGNGPSSEDVAGEDAAGEDVARNGLSTAKERYDAVFRVNDRWLERGLFTRPDVVFTGAADTLLRIGPAPVYGFLNDARALPIVRKASRSLQGLRFFSATDLGFDLAAFGRHKPTNGLLMLHLAVKLQPEQLTVAGIDLYQDPRGCYPDASNTPNHYTSVHDPDRELDMILHLLASYSGQLNIVGESLGLKFTQYTHAETD